jgi:hypothetical protein
MEFLIVMLILAAFAVAAWRWGYDSREITPGADWKSRRILDRVTRYHHL